MEEPPNSQETKVLASDYTVEVSNLPNNITDVRKIKEYFERWGEGT
jgi:hypothetical protein